MIAPHERTLLPARELSAATPEQRRQCLVEIVEQEDFDEVLRWLGELGALQLRFSQHADGRPFSWAQQLRQRYGFQGDLTAAGSILPDQHQMLEECGIDSIRADTGAEAQTVPRFTVNYPH